MKKMKKIIIGTVIIIVVLVALHLSVNYLFPAIRDLHSGVTQY